LPPQLQGIDPSSVNKDDLQKYGVTEGDLKTALSQYGAEGSQPEEGSVEVEKSAPVEKEKVVKPVPEVVVKPVAGTYTSVYGKSFFTDGSLSIYQKATHTKATDSYVLGAGDEITIAIWGFSEHNGNYTIGDNGAITPRLVGKVYLKGVTLGRAKKIIKSRFGSVYDLKNSQINITVNYSKVIRVNIVGEVKTPGTYSINAINSVYNILGQAGGINSIGSVRSINIIRSGKVVKTLDLYDFLSNPVSKNDYFLMDNDYLVVNPVKNLIKVKGYVNRPMTYEMLDGETVSDVIEFAGGYKVGAYEDILHVNRVTNNESKLIELNLNNLNKNSNDLKLVNGDEITVLSISSSRRNYVSINGSINIPGAYAWSDSLTIKDLVIKASGLSLDAYIEKVIVLRRNPDFTLKRITVNLKALLNDKKRDFKLNEFDKITISSKKAFKDEFEVRIFGAVRESKSVAYSEGLTLSELIFLAGGLKQEAAGKRIEVSRIANFEEARKNGDETRIIIESIDISDNLNYTGTDSKFVLKPMDIVFVRKFSGFETQKNISISGEIKFPGTYTLVNKKETLKQIIERSGGITEWAFLEGATIKRVDGEVNFMLLDLKALLIDGKEEYNYVLKNGDEIIIPEIQNLVALTGAFAYPKINEIGLVHVPFIKRKRANYFGKKFGGGFKDGADRKNLIVLTPGGHVKITKSFLGINIYPKVSVGDEISVKMKPEEVKEEKKESNIDWNQVIEKTTVKITAVLTLWILIQNAFN
jgi:protein involved in polysaccharide export with SLBB domain